MAQINKPSEYFNTKLWTGNDSTQSITGVGFQPDLVWIKARNIDYAHNLFDVVRGTTKRLSSGEADAESTFSGLTSFDSDGFTLGSNANCNQSTRTYVGWNWLAVAQLHQTQMEVSHQAYQLIQQVDLVSQLLQLHLLVQFLMWVMD
jgi:hypothetical protein